MLNSGFFAAIEQSRLTTTDPDIGLDVDNPAALDEFYRILADILRVVTAIVVVKGPAQHSSKFLQQSRFSMIAVLKRVSQGTGSLEAKAVADEYAKLLLVTDYLEVS